MIKANPEQSGGRKVKGLLCKREVEETALLPNMYVLIKHLGSKAFFILTRERRFIACKYPISQLTKLTNNKSIIIAHYGWLCFLF